MSPILPYHLPRTRIEGKGCTEEPLARPAMRSMVSTDLETLPCGRTGEPRSVPAWGYS